MALPALQRAMEEVSILPPAFRFADAMQFVTTVQEFKNLVEAREREVLIWRTNMVRMARNAFARMEAAAGDLPIEVYAPLMVRYIDQGLVVARRDLKSVDSRISDRPELAKILSEVAARTVDGGRFMRKLYGRADDVFAKQHQAYMHFINVLREYRARYEVYTSDGPSSADPSEYFKSLAERYSVVNAKLAQ